MAALKPFRIALFLIALATLPCVLVSLGSSAHAEPATATQNAPQAKFIQDLGDKAVTILADKSLTAEQRNTKFRDMLHESFDLPTIGRFVIGRSWNAASPEQQKTYMDLFESLVIKTYSDRFALYTGEGFKVRSVRPESERDSIVTSEITHPDGSAPTTVDWRVRQKDGKLGILDVVVEGISMSQTQRQEYASIIQRNGGDIAPLLDMMRSRLQQQQTTASVK
jgi:phospholipid transport system substrate-binding protein